MPEVAQDISTPEHLPDPVHKGISIDQITHLIEVEGLTITQAADRLNCHKSNISDHLQRNGITPGYLQKYKTKRADVLAYWQHKILNSISTDDIKSASLHQKATAYGILYDKERLERGQSTQNIESHQYVMEAYNYLKNLDQERQKIEERLGNSGDK